MTAVASRIVLDVLYVTRINHEIDFAWQGQYFVKFEDDSCCAAHCTGHFMCWTFKVLLSSQRKFS